MIIAGVEGLESGKLQQKYIRSAILQDIGIVHKGDVSQVIDISKIRRERSKKKKSSARGKRQ